MIKPVENSNEYELYLREVVAPICEATAADPSRLLTADMVEEACTQWDREDGILDETLKRSA